MYKLVHTHTKSYLSQNNHALSWAIHTIQVFLQCQACSKSRKRYYNSCNPQTNKTRHKIKYFCLSEIFQYFWSFFFFFLTKQPTNQKQPKTETKHVHK